MSEEAIKIFYSYSRKDLDMRNTLEKHLATLRKAGKISTWHDLQLEAGTEWEPEILGKLDTADIILLLVSSDFIDSEYCYGTELKRAIERHHEGTARVIPIILRPCDWNHSDVPFSKLNVLPTHAEAIASSPNQDDAFTKVAQKIRETVEQLTTKKQQDKLNQQPPEQHNTKLFQGFQEDLGDGIKLDMVAIAGKQFLMGSPANELQRDDDEGPQHRVGIKSFWIGKYAVTQEQWWIVATHFPQVNRKLAPDPAHFKGDNHPSECVSWLDAVEFCDRLSQNTHCKYRLPSEAEWEYACRAGTKTPFHFGDTITTDLANYDGNFTYGLAAKGTYRKQTTPVGSFSANAFGLSDMHGNVWEWCLDHWHGNYDGAPVDGSAWLDNNDSLNVEALRLLRGGSWGDLPWVCRSARRYVYRAVVQYYTFGFRVVCDVSWTL